MQKMKIAFIVNRFPHLSETFILNQITGLIDRGHDVTIFSTKRANVNKVHPDIEKYSLMEKTCYFEMMPENKLKRIIKGVFLFTKNFYKKPMVLIRSVNIFKYGKAAASLGLLYNAVTMLNSGHYDILHCHFGPYGTLGILLREIGALSGKIVTSFHGYDMSNYIKKYGAHCYDSLFKKGDLFLPISERWENELIKMGCNASKIIVHRMGIDAGKFEFSERAHGNSGKVALLTVARLVEKKGVEYGVHAVASVLDKFPDIEYRIAGDGPLRSTLEHLIEDLNVQNNIKLLGWKHQEEIAGLMQEADILLAPSVTDKNGGQEGIPVVLMEALARGLPVISTYHSGIPELVQDGKSGFLVHERDIEALAEKLAHLIEHLEEWPVMGKAGREYVDENYNIDKLNDRLVELYQNLLNGNSGK
jgi:colanic acid/amylovoran biosynthesis glycosyltransferase